MSKKTKIINQKKIEETEIISLGLLNYNNKNYIIIGLYNGDINIYDSTNLKLIEKKYDDIKFDLFLYFHQLSSRSFLASGNNICIFAFFMENNIFIIKLLQKILLPNLMCHALTSFIFDTNLYKKYDIKEMEDNLIEKNKIKKSELLEEEEELIINSTAGIFIYKRKKDDLIHGNNLLKNEEKKEFDIDKYKQEWNNNKFIYKEKLSSKRYYDIVQVNFKFITGSLENIINLYSMKEKEIITKFEVKTSLLSYKVLAMITNDILFVGGGDTISLISINKFEIIFVYLVKELYKITEICLLPDFNILVSIKCQKDTKDECLLHFKYNSTINF